MIELSHYYSLKGEWQAEAAQKLNALHVRDKIVILPQDFAQGISYFCPVTNGISVVLLDAVFTKEINIKRLISDDDLYILQFDLSEKINTVTVCCNAKNKKFKSGFSVLHTSIENSFKPYLKQRTFALRLLIEKQMLHDLLYQKDKKNKSIKNVEKKILFYDHLNSNNKILINSLKEKHVFDIQYDSYIRGICLKLLANFIETYSNPKREQVTKMDSDLIESTKLYLLDNLYGSFPTLTLLSNMARMSRTKYKILFKKANNVTPNHFFNEQKIILAHKLLQSGAFYSITEISELLNYSKPSYFAIKYLKHFKRKLSDDFVKKTLEV
ncbi:helix-turn-helix domain-containing protein [Flavobacterium aquidurense]|uniref:helix-turn-helix domain-containing protein n=1 Tax=Flavobacterium aquidurense TaxID=362413 RepID=UPI0028637BA7|nr:hypothetical protein [Flavobacterium aquidurense]MDR7371730.1 AraC-like DNA-binding protein [Flavobacterium aquidurense]